MKKSIFIVLFSLVIVTHFFAQAPQFINFQAVARDNSGNPKANQSISVFFNIKDASNTSIYQELQSATTDACGMFNLKIGAGNGVPVSFSQINWASGTKNLEIKIDGVTVGSQQMVSVPFSLYSEKTNLQAGNGISVNGNTITNTGDNDNNPSNEIQTLSISGNTISLSQGGGSAQLPISNISIQQGNGINVSQNGSNYTIANAGDNDSNSSNELQTLSINGNNLSLSQGGGSVNLPVTPNFVGGTGISIAGNTITNTAPSNIITVNSLNMNSISPNNGNVIVIDGDLSLSGPYSKLNKDYTTITGGSVTGNGQSIVFGNYSVITGVKFSNVKITGSWVNFEGCTFAATTELPFDAVLTDCRLTTCDISSSINQISNCVIIGGTFSNVKRTTNSLISSSQWGGNGNNYFIGQVSNCTLSNNTEIEINLSFTGNYCEDSKIRVRNARNTITVTGNDFNTSSSGPTSDLINVDMNTGSNLAVTIANNNFLGNTTIPNGEFIRLYGNYTGTRTITKISNNIVIGGSGKFISYECTGSPAPDLMVNDNDLRSVQGGVGVTNGGFIETRNNVIH